jgi:hypothetical protein
MNITFGGGGAIGLSNVPFNAANFTANGAMTWTVIAGDVAHFRVGRLGKLLYLTFKIGGTVGGVLNTQLFVKVPNSLIIRNSLNFPTIINSFGTGFQMGFSSIAAGNTVVGFSPSQPAPFSNWGAGAAEVNYSGFIEVQ